MGYWEEKEEYERPKIVKSKCPKNPKVEVVWKDDGGGSLMCSYSGRYNCKKCIAKGDYPKNKK